MSDRPILMSSPMVRAILGDKKSQARRTRGLDKVNENPDAWAPLHSGNLNGRYGVLFVPSNTTLDNLDAAATNQIDAVCPYGQTGDLLWVRETWGVADMSLFEREAPPSQWNVYQIGVWYSADEPDAWCRYINLDSDKDRTHAATLTVDNKRLRPSIHMPRYVSRILLEVVSVRVERLCCCSQADAEAEGVEGEPRTIDTGGFTPWGEAIYTSAIDYQEAYAQLWETINGPGSWNTNPWVWVVTFRVIDITNRRSYHATRQESKCYC